MKELHQKLFNLKEEIGTISKDSTNPFFKAKYFDINKLLAEVEPLLQKNNLLLLQPIKNGLVASTIIDIATGQEVSSDIELPTIADPQKLGSAITYYRRYTLQSLLGLQAEDDDGNGATKAWTKNKAQVTPKKKDPSQLEIAIDEVGLCQDMEQLKTTWSAYKNFQKDPKFILAKGNKKIELEKPKS